MVTGQIPSQRPGANPTDGISIEFEIRSKFAVLWFKICSPDPNEMLHVTTVLLSWRVQNFVAIGRIFLDNSIT